MCFKYSSEENVVQVTQLLSGRDRAGTGTDQANTKVHVLNYSGS